MQNALLEYFAILLICIKRKSVLKTNFGLLLSGLLRQGFLAFMFVFVCVLVYVPLGVICVYVIMLMRGSRGGGGALKITKNRVS